MSIAIIGSSGLVGNALRKFFHDREVILIKRDQNGKYSFKPSDFDGVDVIINLAGASISTRWTADMKKKIKDSRVITTRLLSEALQKCHDSPKLVINASAIGYYGTAEEQTFDETSFKGHGFLSDVVDEWEKALQECPTRVVYTRFGIILSPEGGALKKMLLPFKLGLGGMIGDGKQFMSWITIDDVVRAIQHIIEHPEISGAVNFVSPTPVRNEEFTKALGDVLQRPTFLTMPKCLIKLIFGEMGDEVLLSSVKVKPKKLIETGYVFAYPDLKEALAHEIT